MKLISTFLSREISAAIEHMTKLKAEIREKEGLGCSFGIGPNKLIAKIASGHQKPDGPHGGGAGHDSAVPRSAPIRQFPASARRAKPFSTSEISGRSEIYARFLRSL